MRGAPRHLHYWEFTRSAFFFPKLPRFKFDMLANLLDPYKIGSATHSAMYTTDDEVLIYEHYPILLGAD